MNRTTVRWIAMAVVGAMLAAFAVAAIVAGRGGADSSSDGDPDAAAGGSATPVAALDGPHVVVDLCAGVDCPAQDVDAQQALADEVARDGRVASTRLVTSEQAYQLALEEFGDNQDLVAELDPEEVPARVEVDLHDPGDAPDLIDELDGRPGVLHARRPTRAGP